MRLIKIKEVGQYPGLHKLLTKHETIKWKFLSFFVKRNKIHASVVANVSDLKGKEVESIPFESILKARHFFSEIHSGSSSYELLTCMF